MFRRDALPAVTFVVSFLSLAPLFGLAGLAGACSTSSKSAPPAAASGPGDAGTAAGSAPAAKGERAFELTAPAGFREVAARVPLAGAWEAARQANGFTPTLNVTRRSRPAGNAVEVYATWKDELIAMLGKQYAEVKVLGERGLGDAQHGKLLILVVTLPIPGGPTPMPIFTYAAMIEAGDTMWVLGALTGAQLDAKTGDITPVGEPEILKALASFRLR